MVENTEVENTEVESTRIEKTRIEKIGIEKTGIENLKASGVAITLLPATAAKSVAPFRVISGLSVRQDFFELLRRVERGTPDEVRLGESQDRSYLRLRIVQPADMSFAPREVSRLQQLPQRDNRPPLVMIESRHFGLFAPYGPLPIHVTEHARNELLLKRNLAFQDFASLLSQRLALLHYRAWAQLNVTVGHDHPQQNAFLQHIHQVAGITPVQQTNPHIYRLRQAFPSAYLPGRMSLKQLQKIVSRYFAVPITLAAHQAMWVDDSQGHKYQRMGRLGQTRLGRRFFDAQHVIAVRIGPLPSPDYQQYQAGSERLAALISICHDFVGQQRLLDVSLLIRTQPEMAYRLGSGRLSRDGWLKPGTSIYQQPVYQSVI